MKDISKKILEKEFTDKEIEKALKRIEEENNEVNPWFEIDFIVFGDPKAQQRAKASSMGKGKGVVMYDPKEIRNWKATFRKHAIDLLDDDFVLAEGEIEIQIDVYKSAPISTSRIKLALMEMKHLRPEKKPDIDNYDKAVLDALKGVLWKDDSQVVNIVSTKYYSLRPRIEITAGFRMKRVDK